MGTLRDVNIRDIDHHSQYVFLINVTSPSDVRTPPVQRFQITLLYVAHSLNCMSSVTEIIRRKSRYFIWENDDILWMELLLIATVPAQGLQVEMVNKDFMEVSFHKNFCVQHCSLIKVIKYLNLKRRLSIDFTATHFLTMTFYNLPENTILGFLLM